MLKFICMGKTIKQIYVTLQISENELKMLVAEYFNGRFNVLKVERKQTKSINEFKIIDRNLLKQDLIELTTCCSEKWNV